MERKLASIQRIVSLTPIVGADAIEKATVLGWEVVVAKKDNLKVGDLVVYCEVDSILQDKPEFEFLRDRKFRIRTIKLKGQVSQGIVFPLSILPNDFLRKGETWDGLKVGDDMTDVLGVRKYDPQAEFERKEDEKRKNIYKNRVDKYFKRFPWYRKLVFKTDRLPMPPFVRKTDENRIQLFPNACEDYKGLTFQITEKLDGQSATYFLLKNPKKWQFWKKFIFCVCSRNFQILKPDNSTYWRIAKYHDLDAKLLNLYNLTASDYGLYIIQGEIVGVGVQGNKYMQLGIDLFVFDIYENGQRLNNEAIKRRCNHIGLKTVPKYCPDQALPSSIPQMVDFSKQTSALAPIPQEGLVWRNYEKNVSFKVVNPNFLLHYNE